MNDHDPLILWMQDVRQITRQQVVLRATAFVAALGAMVAGDQASDSSPATLLLMFVIVLSAINAALPDSHTGLLLLGVIVLYWSGAIDDPGTPWALVGGLCVLVFHSCTAAAAMIPARAHVDPVVIRRWLVRTGAAALATAATWLLVAAAVADDSPTSAVLVVSALLILTTFGVLLLRRTMEPPT
jgi:hypothetical protein